MRRKTWTCYSTGWHCAHRVLIVAGVGLVIGNSFTSSQVRSQLQEQKVFFPKVAGGTTRTWSRLT